MLSTSTAQQFWIQALEHTRSRSPATFEQWFASVQFDGVSEGKVRLTARDEFVRDWVEDHFLPTLVGRLQTLLGDDLTVEWSVHRELVAPVCPPPRLAQSRRVASRPPGPHLSVPSSMGASSGQATGSSGQGASSSGRATTGTAPLGAAHATAPASDSSPVGGHLASDGLASGSLTSGGLNGREARAFSHELAGGAQAAVLQASVSLDSSPAPSGVWPSEATPAGGPSEWSGSAAGADTPAGSWGPTTAAPSQAGSVHLRDSRSTPGPIQLSPVTDVGRALPPHYSRDVRAPESSRQTPTRRPSVLPGPSSQLNAKYTFENFVVGPSNELAHAAAYASAGGGGPRYNPLFIAGGTGLGKTHLMHAIAHKVLIDRPHARIVYVSAEHFTNEFIEALQNHRMEEFRARYRSDLDVLLVDDIQFLAGREQTQEEFFHTFNALHDAGVPIIVTSDKYPQQLQRMPDRLVSRFTSGLVADVQAPQLETRVAILKKKAQLEQIHLPDSVAVLLAQKVQSNVRELEGSLIRLAAKASLTGRHIDESLLQSEIALVTAPSQKLVCVADIQKAVCGHFRVTGADLLSKDRHKSVAFARQVAMYLCRQRLKSSFPELGRAFGNRDHTTVMSAVRRVEKLRRADPQVNAHLEAIERRLASSSEG